MSEDKPSGNDKSDDAHATSAATVDPRLLEILVCPLTKTRLTYDAEAGELISRAAGLAFPIRDGVPLMTTEAARPLEIDEDDRLR